MNIMKSNRNQSGFAKEILLILLFLVVAILLLVGSIFRNGSNIGTGTEYFPSEGPALVSNSQDLYKSLNNNRQFVLLTENLGVFARATIEEYGLGISKEIAFTIDSPINKNGSVYSFSGFFEADKNKIQITLEPLAYGQINSTITGPENTNIDNFLPSNNQRNKYIATLPFEGTNFSIDYYPTSDTFSISLYDDDPNTRNNALKTLETGVGYTIQTDEYYIFIPSSAGEGIEE